MKNLIKTKNRYSGALWSFCMVVVLLLGITSCDSILDVTDPDIVTPDNLNTVAGIQTLRGGSLGDMAVALSGSSAGHGATTGLIVMSGLMSDEYDYSGTFPTRREGDTRILQNTNVDIDRIYSSLHRSRASAQAALDLAAVFGGAPAVESEMKSLIGYHYVFFAETFCGGVTFSNAPASGELVYGMPLTTQEMFEAAIGWFDDAITSAGTNAQLANLAMVGKARAMLGLGQISAAAAVVASVPTNFVYNIEHSKNSLRQENGIYTMTTVRRQFSIADGKGGNGLMYRSAADPRTPWDGGTTFGQDDITLYYNQLKYTSASDPVVLASGMEARLIEAEAAADATDNALVQSIHNGLRSAIGLPNLDLSGMTKAQLRTIHFAERAFWLYSTGHRQGDLRRLVRVYGEAVSDVFPWGPYFKGGQYASDVTFPIPQSEANNPNYKGCLDKNP